MKGITIFSDFLAALGVQHTGKYSDQRFRTMPFKSLFGFVRLLKEYGVDCQGLQLADKKQVASLPVPFLAKQKNGFVIVEKIGEEGVQYEYYHQQYSKTLQQFLDRFSGTVLLAYPTADSKEPEYAKHHFYALADVAKKWILAAAVVFMLVFGYIWSGIYQHLSLILLSLTDFAGLYVCYLLMQKSLKVKSKAADRFCGVLQKHGCDHVLEQKASSFYGLFGWSEVGMAYFTVSTLLLFIFPEMWHWLALINGCCLPFTVWSITYQKFVIKTWCTLCVTVQTLLWLQFFCFLFGGWWHDIFPLRIELFVAGAAYLAVMLVYNRLLNYMKTLKQ